MSNLVNKMYFKALYMKSKAMNALKNERGEANLISIILILAIVIALALVFKDNIKKLFDQIWGSMFEDTTSGLTNY
ncbi:MAG: hypothetical protein IJB84_07705 [Lachnospiraceae bacterium]|nr:hypothetical protein [Lachnospiraceae bacterium]